MMQWLESYLNGLSTQGPTGAFFFILSFAGLSLLGLPLIPFAVAGGVLFGLVGGLSAVIAGSTLGAAIGFLCSRYVARDRVAARLNKNPSFASIDQAIRREGWKIVALLRMCPLPFGVSNYAYGLTNVPFRHYLAATIIGMLPGETVFVFLGATGRRMGDVSSSPVAKLLSCLGGVALIGVLVLIRQVVSKRIERGTEAGS
ncbi:MAG: VTT domain-containing protein [Verrucomicrobiota bacterium]